MASVFLDFYGDKPSGSGRR